MTETSIRNFIQSIQQQIAEGELQLALDRLQNYLAASTVDLHSEAILYSARYSRLCRDERRGLLTEK